MDKKKLSAILTFALLVIVIVGGSIFYNNQKNKVETNNKTDPNAIPAIDFNVQNTYGTNTYLSDFKDGKPIIINFWSSQCGPCVQEMPDFQRLYDDYKDEVHFVLIDSIGAIGETKELGKAFIKTNGYTFPVYFDINQNAQEAYGITQFPTTYLINGNFEIIRGGAGMITYDSVATVLDDILGE